MTWRIQYLPEAEEDINGMDGSKKANILKTIRRVSISPDVDGYGKPLGNKGGTDLRGLFKIKFKDIGIRVVYKLIRTESEMKIIVISARDDDHVYRLAEKRRKEHEL